MEMGSRLAITPLTTTIGAQVSGVDLRLISPEERVRLCEELDAHSVLVIPGQHLDLEEHTRFAETFGPLEPLSPAKFIGHSAVLTLDGLLLTNDQRPPTDQWIEFAGWHTDSSFARSIPRAAVLRAEVIPPIGGMTSWVSMCAAYDALSLTMQAWLKTLRAVHAYPNGYREKLGVDKMSDELQAQFDEEFAPREHPMVFRHPRSGRCGLFVNPTYTTHVARLSGKESKMLLSFLFTHCANPDFVYRHRWNEGDIVVWDELATLHLAPDPAEYLPHRRRVVRITAGTEEPAAA